MNRLLLIALMTMGLLTGAILSDAEAKYPSDTLPSEGKWVKGIDKTLVITYFPNGYEEIERETRIGFLLINHGDAPQQARVYCRANPRMGGAGSFAFTLDMKANEHRQIYVEHEAISRFTDVWCNFRDRADCCGGQLYLMNGKPSLERETRRPAFDNRVDPPPEPVIDFSDW